MDNRLIIFDTTLRDGEQAPGFSMTIDEKLRMARQLEKLNVDILEAGFPIASEGDFEAVRQVSAEIRTPELWGLRFRRPLLHDGSAATIEDAISRHGGEAALANQGYYQGTAQDRAALLAFLRSL